MGVDHVVDEIARERSLKRLGIRARRPGAGVKAFGGGVCSPVMTRTLNRMSDGGRRAELERLLHRARRAICPTPSTVGIIAVTIRKLVSRHRR